MSFSIEPSEWMNWRCFLISPADPPKTSVRSSVHSRETMSPIPSLPPPPTNCSSPRPPPAPSSCAPVLRLLSHLLAFCIYSITTGLLLSICLDRLATRRSGRYLHTGASLLPCCDCKITNVCTAFLIITITGLLKPNHSFNLIFHCS